MFSLWGADDRRGAVNRLTPEKVLEAASLIKTGEVFQLGRVYESGIPVFGTRHYSLRIPAMSGPLGENKTTWSEEVFSGEIGQIGDQFDGLGHVGKGTVYNGDKQQISEPLYTSVAGTMSQTQPSSISGPGVSKAGLPRK